MSVGDNNYARILKWVKKPARNVEWKSNCSLERKGLEVKVVGYTPLFKKVSPCLEVK